MKRRTVKLTDVNDQRLENLSLTKNTTAIGILFNIIEEAFERYNDTEILKLYGQKEVKVKRDKVSGQFYSDRSKSEVKVEKNKDLNELLKVLNFKSKSHYRLVKAADRTYIEKIKINYFDIEKGIVNYSRYLSSNKLGVGIPSPISNIENTLCDVYGCPITKKGFITLLHNITNREGKCFPSPHKILNKQQDIYFSVYNPLNVKFELRQKEVIVNNKEWVQRRMVYNVYYLRSGLSIYISTLSENIKEKYKNSIEEYRNRCIENIKGLRK